MTFLKRITKSRVFGLWLGLLFILLFGLFAVFPMIGHWVYRQCIFQIIRILFDFTFGLLPFPAAFILAPLYVGAIIIYLYRTKGGIKFFFARLLNVTGYTLALFLLLWGFNYACAGISGNAKDMALQSDQLFRFGEEVNQHCASLRAQIGDQVMYHHSEEQELRDRVEEVISSFGLPVVGRVRCRLLDDEGRLRKMGIAGFYFPFHQEGYASSSYLPATVSFIRAHEMSHGYGITHEGEADFVAYLALSGSQDPAIQYAGELELLRNIRGRLKTQSPEDYQKLRDLTDPGVRDDLRAIYRNGLGYQEYVPGVQEKFNDLYLKLMGVKEGVDSYETMVEMVYAHQSRPSVPK
jgi:Protein of unknown function (DUF3810)